MRYRTHFRGFGTDAPMPTGDQAYAAGSPVPADFYMTYTSIITPTTTKPDSALTPEEYKAKYGCYPVKDLSTGQYLPCNPAVTITPTPPTPPAATKSSGTAIAAGAGILGLLLLMK